MELVFAAYHSTDKTTHAFGLVGSIELLERWGVITSGLSKQISKIKAVRNQLAHRWNEKEVFYGKDANGIRITIVENIDKFKKDAEMVWTSLIDIYMLEEEKEIGRVISKLDDPNTINIYKEMNEARKPYDYDDL